MQGAYALVRGGSSTSNLVEPYHYRDSKVCRVLSHTLTHCTHTTHTHNTHTHTASELNCTNGDIRLVGSTESHQGLLEVCFNGYCTEPSLSTSLQGKHGVQGAYALVRGSSSCVGQVELCHISSGWFNHIEPHRTPSKR